LLKRLVDFDGFGCPSGMHDENGGPGAAAAGIDAIAFDDGDYRVVVGVAFSLGRKKQPWTSVSPTAPIWRRRWVCML
jgi:hypothetical protein